MSTNDKTTTTRRTRRTPATDTSGAPVADTTATDPVAGNGAAGPATATEPMTDAVTEPVADGEATSEESGTAEPEASWSDALPWLALQVGSRPSVPETTIAVSVWTMLHAAPGATALRLAADAEAQGVALDPAVVTKVLGRYQRSGIATSVVEDGVTRWSPVSPGEIVARVRRDMTNPAGARALSAGGRGVRVAVGDGLPAGGLRQAVAEFLAAHPGQDLTPTEISRGLGGRSAGAVSKACERLVGDRIAVRTSDRPCRYQHAPGDDSTDPAGQTPDTAETATVTDAAN